MFAVVFPKIHCIVARYSYLLALIVTLSDPFKRHPCARSQFWSITAERLYTKTYLDEISTISCHSSRSIVMDVAGLLQIVFGILKIVTRHLVQRILGIF